jgi:ABC-2 type transport system permease protein
LGGLRAVPTLMKVGFAEAVAYRAEMVVWVLATTMPLVMLALWTAVAEAAPVASAAGRSWSSGAFVAYFLTVFVVRQLVSSWASWEINFEVRQGLLSMRLLRPLHPVVSYLVQNLAYLPMRVLVTTPVIAVLLLSSGAEHLPRDPLVWALFVVSLVLGWMVSFFANISIGALSLFMESSVKIMDVWLAAFFVFSGYLFPIDLFPGWLRTASDWLPFRSIIGVPVELATGSLDLAHALPMLARQAGWAAGFMALSWWLWRRGISRFQAYGG